MGGLSALAMQPAPFGGISPIDKIMGYNPLVFFPLTEVSGTAAEEFVNGWDGLYQGPTVGAGVGPFGDPCPFFDGVNDSVITTTADLIAAWDGDEVCTLAWGRVFNAGVWTDGAAREVWRARDAGFASIQYMRKQAANNQVQWFHRVGGVGLLTTMGGVSTTDWFHMGIKATGGSARAYWNGAPFGAAVAHNPWVNALFGAWIGASGPAAGSANWHGWLAYVALWFGAGNLPSDDDIAELATI